MIIRVKNKDTLIAGEFRFKCSIGRSGTRLHKLEGDGSTPKGIYKFGKVYWRNDREKKPFTGLSTVKIKKKMVWCNDIKSKYYNKQINKNKNIRSEKLFRKDYKYNYFITINYNTNNTKKGKGSAIFLHLTRNYSKTAGCIAVKKKDFLILLKLINKNSKIKIY